LLKSRERLCGNLYLVKSWAFACSIWFRNNQTWWRRTSYHSWVQRIYSCCDLCAKLLGRSYTTWLQSRRMGCRITESPHQTERKVKASYPRWRSECCTSWYWYLWSYWHGRCCLFYKGRKRFISKDAWFWICWHFPIFVP